MSSIAAMTVLGVAAIVFYLRFLVALRKECKPHRSWYLVRLQPSSDEHALPNEWECETSIPQAA